MLHRIILTWKKTNLGKRISLGILCGALLAVLFKLQQLVCWVKFSLWRSKNSAPLLVFFLFLVANALSQQKKGREKSNMKTVIATLSVGNICLAAARISVLVGFVFFQLGDLARR